MITIFHTVVTCLVTSVMRKYTSPMLTRNERKKTQSTMKNSLTVGT